ncbi:MED6 mediator sub complex component-domain-containing protein [Xylariaceae sp. FL0016]|nr:MED6 mediator sub complex component-domain-containing protein [Xylariaceae sp. FL0016]
MASQKDPPLDEIQWRMPHFAQELQGIHSNSVLFYFAESPFFDRTSNNAVLQSQAMFNPNMFHLVQTREAFEGRLKEMSGLEFIVAQEPAEMAPGTGTGVWVIRKQTRRKREPEDDITIHATYYVVGDNIYMAPTLSNILSFRMATISFALAKTFPPVDEAQSWSPSQGHRYRTTPSPTNTRDRLAESKGATPLPESQANKDGGETKKTTQSDLASRLASNSWMIHEMYGGEYMDENPITGKPGEFHLSSTGRKDMLLQIPALDTSLKSPLSPGLNKKDGKGDKTPKTPTGVSKAKRKKSKSGQTPTAQTPTSY